MILNSDDARIDETSALLGSTSETKPRSSNDLNDPQPKSLKASKPPIRPLFTQNPLQNQLFLAINDSRSTSCQNASICILLLINCLERFAYYGIICNYILYLNRDPLDWMSYNATTMLLIFQGITFMSSLIGGWIADSLIGKYNTIAISYVIYIIGYSIYPIISWHSTQIPSFCSASTVNSSSLGSAFTSPNPLYYQQSHHHHHRHRSLTGRNIYDESCSWTITFAVVTLGFAIGVLKANLGPFGANQVYSRGQSMVFKYFNWLYWSINLGSLLAFLFLAFIQQNMSFFVGYLIPFGALIFSFLLFLSGSGCYIKAEVEISVLSNVFKVIIEAYRSVKRQKNLIRQTQRERALLSEDRQSNNNESDTDSIYESYNTVSKSNFMTESTRKKISWLDNAKIRYGGRYDVGLVDDVKSLKKIIILFAIMIPYWLVYVQMETMFVVQGLHTKVLAKKIINTFGFTNFVFPVAWLSLIDSLAILILIPVLDSFVYPYFRRNMKFTGSMRVVLGMSFSALAVIVAGLFETYRVYYFNLDPEHNTITQDISNTTYDAADLSITWQIPQYIFVGFGEVFCSVSAVYYAYTIAPKSMEAIIMGLFYFFSGVGNFLGGALLVSLKTLIFSSEFQDDINCPECKLNYYFYLLGILQISGILAFIWSDSKYNLITEKVNNDETNNENIRVLLSPTLSLATPDTSTLSNDRFNETGSPVNV